MSPEIANLLMLVLVAVGLCLYIQIVVAAWITLERAWPWPTRIVSNWLLMLLAYSGMRLAAGIMRTPGKNNTPGG